MLVFFVKSDFLRKVSFFGPFRKKSLERNMGIEPTKPSAWQADMQPITPIPQKQDSFFIAVLYQLSYNPHECK
jgi:hypothetical protein